MTQFSELSSSLQPIKVGQRILSSQSQYIRSESHKQQIVPSHQIPSSIETTVNFEIIKKKINLIQFVIHKKVLSTYIPIMVHFRIVDAKYLEIIFHNKTKTEIKTFMAFDIRAKQ